MRCRRCPAAEHRAGRHGTGAQDAVVLKGLTALGLNVEGAITLIAFIGNTSASSYWIECDWLPTAVPVCKSQLKCSAICMIACDGVP